jgi:hypothetical protein
MKTIKLKLKQLWQFLSFVLDETEHIKNNTTYGNKF